MILDSINRYSALKNLEEIQNESLKRYSNDVNEE